MSTPSASGTSENQANMEPDYATQQRLDKGYPQFGSDGKLIKPGPKSYVGDPVEKQEVVVAPPATFNNATNSEVSIQPAKETKLTPKEKMLEAVYELIPAEYGDKEEALKIISTQVMGTAKDGSLRPLTDMLYFLMQCKRFGLDPFAKQIYAVYRYDKRAGKDKLVIQTGIDGYRAIAQRTGLYGGQDDIVFDDETGEHPNKATATVYRLNPKTGERMATSASARWKEYRPEKRFQYDDMWDKLPFLMLGKVAESLALRKAFANELSGIYTNEEMQQADKPVNVANVMQTNLIDSGEETIDIAKQ